MLSNYREEAAGREIIKRLWRHPGHDSAGVSFNVRLLSAFCFQVMYIMLFIKYAQKN